MACSMDDVSAIEKLRSSENFQSWKFQIEIVFKSQELDDIVNGTNKIDAKTTDEARKKWIKFDARAQKLIISTIDKRNISHIMNCKGSNEMFKKLCNIYGKEGDQNKCSIMQEFFMFKYEEGIDISTHISKLENLAHRLKAMGNKIDDNMLISKILTTLPDQYRHFISAWESTAETGQTLTNLTTRLLTEEGRIKKETNETPVVFKATEKGCFKCGNPSHIARFCRNSVNTENKNKINCFRCSGTGHLSKQCVKKTFCTICKKNNHNENACFFRKSKTGRENKEKAVTFMAHQSTEEYEQIEWIVDSGCSTHMTNNKDLLNNFENKKTEVSVAKKSSAMVAQGIGEFKSTECILKGVLYVPELSKNLLSVTRITNNNGEVTFSDNNVYIQKNKEKIVKGNKTETGLYMVKLNQGKQETAFVTSNKNDIVDWHRKLGHIGVQNLIKLTTMSEGIKIPNEQKELNSACEICLKAKQTRFPFKTVRTRATRPLEIVHTDVCGPIEPSTWNNKKYFVSFLDDYTHFVMIYLIEGKHEVKNVIQEYAKEVEAKFNLKISKIRCDNGKEYKNEEIKNWCRRKGIILDLTIPYTPQLNGKAERLNRTIMEKARALILDSKFEKEMWGEAVYVAAYLLNRSPTEALDVTPVEKWTGKKPNLSNLQIFGSLAFAKNLGYLKKLDDRSLKYKFVGYTLNGYRLWNEENRKIIVARDVVFAEDKPMIRSCVEVQVSTQTDDDSDKNSNTENNENENNDETKEDSEVQELDTTRYRRKTSKPKYLDDYETYFAYYSAAEDPKSYGEAAKDEKWKEAIMKELKSHEDMETWTPAELPKNKIAIDTKWIFRTKEDGTKKARIVAKGFQQHEENSLDTIYAPVARMSTVRSLIVHSIQNEWNLHQLDIPTAFLNGQIESEIYIKTPEGRSNTTDYLRLKRSLYGLKEAPKCWNKRFNQFMLTHGLNRSYNDCCLYYNKDIWIVVYVDDILLTGKDCEVDKMIKKLEEEFSARNMGNPTTFLGLQMTDINGEIKLNQTNLINKLLKVFNMQNCKGAQTPMERGFQIPENENIIDVPFRQLIGSLMYLSTCTRPDIMFSVAYLSRVLDKPSETTWKAGKRILRYLQATKDIGLVYKKSDEKLIEGYSDADWAGDHRDRKSVNGAVVNLCGNPVAWISKKQTCVALSTTEAEYVAASNCAQEMMNLKGLASDFGERCSSTLFVDNQSAIFMINATQNLKRGKHIDIRAHYVKDLVDKGEINVKYIPTDLNLADMLTKPLDKTKLNTLKELMNLK